MKRQIRKEIAIYNINLKSMAPSFAEKSEGRLPLLPGRTEPAKPRSPQGRWQTTYRKHTSGPGSGHHNSASIQVSARKLSKCSSANPACPQGFHHLPKAGPVRGKSKVSCST